MNNLTARIYGLNWKLMLSLVTLVAFALTGSADDPSPT